MTYFKALTGFAAGAVALIASASAATITQGFTFTVADDGAGGGLHYHSSTNGDFGNAAGLAGVGNWSSEEERGMSEYDLTGLSSAASAFVTFDMLRADAALSYGYAQYLGNIRIEAYVGNNTEDETDFSIASVATVATFSAASLVAGDTLSFDITALFNSLVGTESSLGLRLVAENLVGNTAITFNNFRLTTDNLSTNPVPVPAAALLFAPAIIGGAVARRRRKA